MTARPAPARAQLIDAVKERNNAHTPCPSSPAPQLGKLLARLHEGFLEFQDLLHGPIDGEKWPGCAAYLTTREHCQQLWHQQSTATKDWFLDMKRPYT